ncbi:MAG: STAS domain-containing protein [Spirochaetia bacterium]|nr:STAS domain-containing protein [Spirochaetia bacterium]
MSEKKEVHGDQSNSIVRERYAGASAAFSKARSMDEPSLLSIAGTLDGESAGPFYTGCSSIISRLTSGSRLELRLDEVVSISSTGVGALTRLFAEASGCDVKMYIGSMSPACRDVFSVLGLNSYMSLPGQDR